MTLQQIQDDYSNEMDTLFESYKKACGDISAKYKTAIEQAGDDGQKMSEILQEQQAMLANELQELKQKIQLSRKSFFKRIETNFSALDQNRMDKLDELLEQA